ncbi:hypothetical protein FIM09_06380, partial [SAR202 cluster bacterium AC-647-P02_OGT_505m]|nr:hypothetical protein [SAR202 cluster bacterium AC-647-P02_OGT_505m]
MIDEASSYLLPCFTILVIDTPVHLNSNLSDLYTPAPPVGPALGQHGVNIMGFVKEYNERTSSLAGSIV